MYLYKNLKTPTTTMISLKMSIPFYVSLLLLIVKSQAFTLVNQLSHSPSNPISYNNAVSRRSISTTWQTRLYATSSDEQAQKDDEIERLQSMAAKLRAEALALEAERAKELSDAAERAFLKFDKNQVGSLSYSFFEIL